MHSPLRPLTAREREVDEKLTNTMKLSNISFKQNQEMEAPISGEHTPLSSKVPVSDQNKSRLSHNNTDERPLPSAMLDEKDYEEESNDDEIKTNSLS